MIVQMEKKEKTMAKSNKVKRVRRKFKKGFHCQDKDPQHQAFSQSQNNTKRKEGKVREQIKSNTKLGKQPQQQSVYQCCEQHALQEMTTAKKSKKRSVSI
jgi:hypothetical protein